MPIDHLLLYKKPLLLGEFSYTLQFKSLILTTDPTFPSSTKISERRLEKLHGEKKTLKEGQDNSMVGSKFCVFGSRGQVGLLPFIWE